jgi:hypothetical protein
MAISFVPPRDHEGRSAVHASLSNRKLYRARFPLGFVGDLTEVSSNSEETWRRREGGGGEETVAEERGGGGARVVRAVARGGGLGLTVASMDRG